MLTAAHLSQILMCPLTLAQRWADPLNVAMDTFDITTPRRQAHFLAQLGHESHSLQTLQELLSYSPKRIRDEYGCRVAEAEHASYARKPERLANRVHADRGGNGDEASGDGYRYRGRGPLPLRGRGDYRRIGVLIGMPLEDQPELMESPEVAALAAAAWWHDAGLNVLADKDDLLAISRHVNLGSAACKATPQALSERGARTRRALVALGTMPRADGW